MAELLAKDMKWPHCKGSIIDSNVWNTGLSELMAALDGAKDDRWWIVDTDLKYLNLRIDTRDNAFWLTVTKPNGDPERVDPQRVVDAIEDYQTRYGEKSERS